MLGRPVPEKSSTWIRLLRGASLSGRQRAVATPSRFRKLTGECQTLVKGRLVGVDQRYGDLRFLGRHESDAESLYRGPVSLLSWDRYTFTCRLRALVPSVRHQ